MDAQIAWLRTVLEAHQDVVDWRVVFFHVPVWSSGAHGNNEDDAARADLLVPLLDEFRVELVIHGNDHDYERFHPSRGGYGGSPRVVTPLAEDQGRSGTPQGTTYVVTGGGGALLNPTFTPDDSSTARAAARLHYAVVDVHGPR